MKSLVLALSLIFAPVLHDYFVSICTISHNVEEKRLQITWRMTTHDIEHALAPFVNGRKLQLGSELELPEADSLLQAYLLEHLLIEVDGEPVTVEYLGRDVEMEDMFCFLQVTDIAAYNTISVHSTLLFDVFDDQENVVHLETEDGTLTYSFKNNSLPYTFMPTR